MLMKQNSVRKMGLISLHVMKNCSPMHEFTYQELQKMLDLELGSADVTQRLESTKKDLADCLLFLQENQAKMKSLQETIAAQEKVKCQLEERIALRKISATKKPQSSVETKNEKER